MSGTLILPSGGTVVGLSTDRVPTIVVEAGPDTVRRYLEFFAASIRNANTRAAYLIASQKFFTWCEQLDIGPLHGLQRVHVAAYIEQLTQMQSAPTVKQNLAALRMLFEFLRAPAENPADKVRGPKHVVRTGRTPVLSAPQARQLLESIPTSTLTGLRDKALLSVMVYSFARISAVVGLDVPDYHYHGARRWFRLHEKGGKEHAVPVHHRAEEYIDLYLSEAGIADGPLFRTTDHGRVTLRRFDRFAAWQMVKRRAKAAGLPESTTNHTFRATGITTYLENGGTIENARNIAAHASIRTTQCYDRRGESVTLDEINRIQL